ncbi:MAG TPA: radical SAM family heme chaperone HemW [Bacteroidia bacterium]
MAGIYLHIPFCKQACHYCDFHFSTSLKNKKEFLKALQKEVFLRKDYLRTKEISTVYFGGGTPSVLSKEEILEVFSALSNYFSIDPDAEITLEANPEDLSKQKLKDLSETPVNRLSIGIQSFSDEDLKFLNRVHTAREASGSVKEAQDTGFKNITIDLIYGIQTLTHDQWKKNMEQAFALNVPHISCYSLTVEDGTALANYIKKGTMPVVSSEKSADQFEMLMNEMKRNGFIQYEISNFCKEGFESKHNNSYWQGETYLGLGPSAHSFDGVSRQWNISSNAAYLSAVKKGELPAEAEVLTETQKFNEYVLTALRTNKGMDLNFVREKFPSAYYSLLQDGLIDFIKQKLVLQKKNKIILSDKGKLFADKIASDLFLVS